MIRQRIYLPTEQWHVTAYYAVTHYDVDEIIRTMQDAGARDADLGRTYDNLSSSNLNTGLCYSGNHQSVLVISVASSPKQFFNSLFHEIHHLASHIGDRIGYDLQGEEVCYLAGEIAERMYPVVKEYLCECCRNKT